MQRYDDFLNHPSFFCRFCIKNAFLLMYIKQIVCEHTQIVSDNS